MIYFYLFFLDLGNVNNNRERKGYERKLLLNPITCSHAIVKDNAHTVYILSKDRIYTKIFCSNNKDSLLEANYVKNKIRFYDYTDNTVISMFRNIYLFI